MIVNGPQDISLAIGEIAQEFVAETGYTYIAGLCLEDLHGGLLWRGPFNEVRPANGRYLAP
jgi:hypothetical protein